MAYIDFMPIHGKRTQKNFAEVVAKEKVNSVARKALHDLIVFNDAIEEEIQQLQASAAQGHGIDSDLLAKTMLIKEKYLSLLASFERADDQQEHLALVVYAD